MKKSKLIELLERRYQSAQMAEVRGDAMLRTQLVRLGYSVSRGTGVLLVVDRLKQGQLEHDLAALGAVRCEDGDIEFDLIDETMASFNISRIRTLKMKQDYVLPD